MFGVRTIQKSPSAISPEDKDKRSRTFLSSNSSISCASNISSYNSKSKPSLNPALSTSFGARTRLGSASFGSSAVKITQNMCASTNCCDICATLPFNVRALTDSDGGDSEEDLTLKKVDSDDDMEQSMNKKPCCVGFGGGMTSKRLERVTREVETKCDDGIIPDVARLTAKEVKTGKRVGKGGSASVYEVTSFNLLPTTSVEDDNGDSLRHNLKETSAQKQEKYVLKRMSKNLLAPGGAEKQSKFAHAAAVNMLLEAQFLRFMNHPNIVSLAALGECDSENLFLVMTCLPESMEQRISSWRKQVKRHRKKQLQYANAPSYTKWSILCKAEQQRKQQFSAHLELRRLLYERLHVAKDVAAGVGYLHEQGIIYRDLKTSNIGFDVEGKVKLFDFGISRFLPAPMQDEGNLEDSFAMSKVGTKMFMAPEIAEKKPYGLKADCYSFGVLLWQLLAMANPQPIFHAPLTDEDADSSSMAYDRIISTNRSGPRFEFPLCACWPMFVQSLLRRILQRNPKLRPSMDEIERKLDGAMEKLWKEIQQDEEAMFAPAPSSPTSVASVASLSPKKGVIPYLFGNDAYNRQKTAEIDYENEQF